MRMNIYSCQTLPFLRSADEKEWENISKDKEVPQEHEPCEGILLGAGINLSSFLIGSLTQSSWWMEHMLGILIASLLLVMG